MATAHGPRRLPQGERRPLALSPTRRPEQARKAAVIDYIGNHRSFLLKPQTLFSLPAGGQEAGGPRPHTGERLMGITWKLETPMPAALFERFAALLAA